MTNSRPPAGVQTTVSDILSSQLAKDVGLIDSISVLFSPSATITHNQRQDMQFVTEPVWNWPLLLIVIAVMLGTLLWTYPARVRHLSPFWQRLLIGLRLLAAFVLIIGMLRPAIQFTEKDDQPVQVSFLMDISRSMSTPDGPGGLSRHAAALKMFEDNQAEFDALAEVADLNKLNFSSTVTRAEEFGDVTDGEYTAIGQSIDTLRENFIADRLFAVVLISDGAQRAGGEADIDPGAAARRFAEQLQIPIHTVTVGTSDVSTSGIDLAIQDLQLDQSVTFEKKTVPVHLQLRLSGAAGKDVTVRLLIEDRTGVGEGQSGEFKEILATSEAKSVEVFRPTRNAETRNLDLSFVANTPGEYKIAAEIVPDDGEVKLNNNRRETLITVRKGGLKVAYFDLARPEMTFLRRLNETAKIQVDTQAVLSGQFASRTKIDPAFFEKDAYDVFIIGDVPASAFKAGQEDLLRKLALRVNEGAGLVMIGGMHNLGAGGYASTILAEFLPVKMSPSDEIGPTDERPEGHLTKEIRVLPTPDGEDHYLMRLGANNRDTWERLPKLGGANKLVRKSGAVEVLAETDAGDPVLFATDTGAGRVLVFGVDETWKWHTHGFKAEHQRFWQQLILWLAHKEFESDQPVWVRVEPRSFAPHLAVPIEFGAQDENGIAITDAEYAVEVLTPSGDVKKLTPQRFADHGIAEFTDTGEPGDYWVRVNATSDGQMLGLTTSTRFVVDSRDIEMDNPAADPGTMSEIANISGGSVVPVESFGEFLQRLKKEGVMGGVDRFRRINLWDGWLPLLIFISLISLEWVLRKVRGLV